MSIASNIAYIRKQLPSQIKLVCVSKFHPDEAIVEAYNAGERVFGESKVQEMSGKYERLPKDIEWHFIGHLQSNKVKYIVPFVSLIHGVDSEKLLAEIDKNAQKAGRVVNCLLQVHIATEETKFGFDQTELLEFCQKNRMNNYPNIQICGLMGMATFSQDKKLIAAEFKQLKEIFEKLKSDYFTKNPAFSQLSMGMSDDFSIAIECGSTMVRIGSSIFGTRVYN
ncbi:MAG: YggS family pyridoxal phosphate-dependent enzyme [Paludibacter sp.]